MSVDVEGAILQCCSWAPPKDVNYGNVFTMEKEGLTLKDMWLKRLANKFTSKLCQSCNMKSPFFVKRVAAMRIN
jgi:radical SAM protein with 4Fe4S-binding SPASM domain